MGPILLIEDDVELCGLMQSFFTEHGITIECAFDGRAGLAQALKARFELVILDVMLPIVDGFEVLRQIRQRNDVPVIMLTARTAQSDRITGLDCGADDYLPKPFGPEELLARIRAVLRRSKGGNALAEIVSVGRLRLDVRSRSVWRDQKRVPLTAAEFDILGVLMRSAGRIVSRDEISAVLYQRPATPYERSLDVHISHLRQKIERDGTPMIQTVRGQGYLFAAEPAPSK